MVASHAAKCPCGRNACVVVMLSSAPRIIPLPLISPEKAYFLKLYTMQPLYKAPIMEPTPHSCPHCLGQDEKRLLFRKGRLSSPMIHANSHTCSLASSVSNAGRGGRHFVGFTLSWRQWHSVFYWTLQGSQGGGHLAFPVSAGGPDCSGSVGWAATVVRSFQIAEVWSLLRHL